MKLKQFAWISIVTATLGLASPEPAQAHMVETNYGIDLFTSDLSFQSTYSDGKPMAEAEVFIYAPNNREEPWLTTETDDHGQFVFSPDESIVGIWRVEIKQEGHMDILDVPVGSQGLEFNNISRSGQQDLHYANLPWSLTLAWLGGGMAAGLMVFLKRRYS